MSFTPLTLRSRQIFRGLAERRDIPFRYRYRERLAGGVPIGTYFVGPRRSVRFLVSAACPGVSAESAEPVGLVILSGSNPAPLHCDKEPHSAGPTPPNHRRGRLPRRQPWCQRGKDRYPPKDPHPVPRLPRLSPCPLCPLRPSDCVSSALLRTPSLPATKDIGQQRTHAPAAVQIRTDITRSKGNSGYIHIAGSRAVALRIVV